MELADRLYPWLRGTGARLIGINGPQGSGKSTLCAALIERAAEDGLRWVTLSTDDVYWPHAKQRRLAAAFPADPLMAVRGAPGTHDVALGTATLDALRGDRGEATIPRYDKKAHGGAGDRLPQERWDTVTLPVDAVLFEGWTLGWAPVGAAAGEELGNVDRFLADCAPWTGRLEALVQLRMVDPSSVLRWRVEAEQRRRTPEEPGMSDADAAAYVERFLPLYRVYPAALEATDLGIPRRTVWLDGERRPVAP